MPNKLHAALIAVAVVVAGCGGDDGDTASPSTAVPGTTTTSISISVPAFDWSRPRPVDLGGGWAIEDCEGAAPLFCVRRDGQIVGSLEAARYPRERPPRERAAEFLDAFRSDRGETCPGQRYAADEIVDLTIADGAAIRYGFTLFNGTDVVERVVQYAGERGGEYVVLVANAVDEGGCIAREGEFATADLIAFESRLDALVRVSGLP